MTNPETQLASYFAKYEAPIAKLGKALRAKLRSRLPGLFEIVYVYENQNSLVISYSATEHGYEAPCTLAVNLDHVKLYFGHGAELSKSDPKKLLQGSGKMVRYVVMNTVADFDRPEIEAFMAAVLKLSNVRIDPSAESSIIIKAEEQKQRAQRAKKAAKSTKKATKARR